MADAILHENADRILTEDSSGVLLVQTNALLTEDLDGDILLEDGSGAYALEFPSFEILNSAEGGTHGVAATPANTGGVSGEPFVEVDGVVSFSNAHPSSGSLGYDMGTTTTDNEKLWWEDASIPAGITEMWGRNYFYVANNWPQNYAIVWYCLTSGAALQNAYGIVLSDGQLYLKDNGGFDMAPPVQLSLNTLYRIEFWVLSHITNGAAEQRVYLGQATDPIFQQVGTNVPTGGGDIRWFGIQHNITSTAHLFVDEITINNERWPLASPITVAGAGVIAATTTFPAATIRGTSEIEEIDTIEAWVDMPTPTIQITPTPQIARPDADSSIGTWTTQAGGSTNLWDTLNESVASDTDYVKSAVDVTNNELIVTLVNIEDPLSSTGHVVRFRRRKT